MTCNAVITGMSIFGYSQAPGQTMLTYANYGMEDCMMLVNALWVLMIVTEASYLHNYKEIASMV